MLSTSPFLFHPGSTRPSSFVCSPTLGLVFTLNTLRNHLALQFFFLLPSLCGLFVQIYILPCIGLLLLAVVSQFASCSPFVRLLFFRFLKTTLHGVHMVMDIPLPSSVHYFIISRLCVLRLHTTNFKQGVSLLRFCFPPFPAAFTPFFYRFLIKSPGFAKSS